MAKNRGWWTLTLNENRMEDLSDFDREHIGNLIKEGFTSGEITEG